MDSLDRKAIIISVLSGIIPHRNPEGTTDIAARHCFVPSEHGQKNEVPRAILVAFEKNVFSKTLRVNDVTNETAKTKNSVIYHT